jgi:hypothetical protein
MAPLQAAKAEPTAVAPEAGAEWFVYSLEPLLVESAATLSELLAEFDSQGAPPSGRREKISEPGPDPSNGPHPTDEGCEIRKTAADRQAGPEDLRSNERIANTDITPMKIEGRT